MLADFVKPEVKKPILHGKPISLLGSCFSENMVPFFRAAGFDVGSNPWGTVFHPYPLLEVLANTVDEQAFLQRSDIWLSYQASGSLYGFSKSELKEKLEEAQSLFLQQMKDSSILIITFGTANGYQLLESERLVANCHKVPGNHFRKVLSDTHQMEEVIVEAVKRIFNQFPDLQIVLTLSPVRYKRDGWVESQRSKARLLESIHLATEQTDAIYFPAYELVIDLLRDYSWFQEDGVHPNHAAMQQVFELFQKWFFDADTQKIIAEAAHIRKLEQHRILYPGSKETEAFLKSVKEKRESFLSLHSNFIW